MTTLQLPSGRVTEVDMSVFADPNTRIYAYEDLAGNQTFFNVDRGYEIAVSMPEILFAVSLSEMGMTAERLVHDYPILDIARADAPARDGPLLFVEQPFAMDEDRPEILLIDGWHRCYSAIIHGVDRLDAYILPLDQRQEIVVLRLAAPDRIDIRSLAAVAAGVERKPQ